MRAAGEVMDVLSLEDVSAVIRLLGTLSDPALRPAGDVNLQRRRLFDGLAEIVEACGWTWLHGRRNPDGNRIMVFSSLDRFHAETQRQHMLHMLIDDRTRAPLDPPLNRMFSQGAGLPAPQGHFTRSRDQLIDDDAWYASAMYQTDYRGAGLEDFLVSIYPLGEHTWSGNMFFRAAGQAPFGPREHALVYLILSNVDWLHRDGSDVQANTDELVELPPRTREVLCYLVKGDPPKQISYKLGLSVHTVQDHIKAIYRRFNVNSRGELLAKFIAGPPPVAAEHETASTP